ncbi:MAG: sulfite exporter TauE/SafE family protein [Actinomycetota bacterium]|nr:sulfite exporter TauE/SafE family protein [Actinomycetota bacterium]
MNWVAISVIGAVVGFLAGVFGKGGSAVATPLLHAAGVPAIVAVAAPLPATIPSTLVAFSAYWHSHVVDRQVLWWSIAIGVPATIAGALTTRWIDGAFLVRVTDAVIAGIGVWLLLRPDEEREMARDVRGYRARLVLVAAVVGVAAGLLANSGGFLLAPLYLIVLRMPLKPAFACSLAVSAALAIPGTIVHAALGHVDWTVVALFGLTSVPLSFLGARVAVRANSHRLEKTYGAVLVVLGVGFLAYGS